jgi:hypothetical protein
MASSVITVGKAIERLDNIYLDDEKNAIWNPTAKFWALNEAIEDVALLIADQAPTILMETAIVGSGIIGAVTEDPSIGDGSMTVSGTPQNTFDVVITITGGGVLGSASFKYSLQTGGAEITGNTVPADGIFVVPGTGMTLQFVEGPPGGPTSFVLGDKFIFSVTIGLIAGQVEYDLPTDFLRAHSVTANIQGLTTFPKFILLNTDVSEEGQMVTGWYIRNDKIGVRILEQLIGDVTLLYVKKPVQVWATTDTFPFMDEWASLAILGTAIHLKVAKGMDAGGLIGMYAKKEMRLVSSYAMRSSDVTTRGVISTGHGF